MHYRLSELLNKVPLSSGVQRFMRALGKHYGDSHDHGEIWVRQQTLAEEENISRSTIWRNAQEAIKLGLIFVKKQFHKNRRQKCSIYQINWILLYELAGQKAYSDQLPVTESETVELPEIEDILTYIDLHDTDTKSKLTDTDIEMFKYVPIVAKCSTSKEKRLYIKNISPPVTKKPPPTPLEKEEIRTSDPKLISHYIQQMRDSIFRRQ